MSRQVRLLARHFFWRFFDNDLVSPESDAHEAASLAIAFLATPGILRSGILFLRYGNPWLPPPERLTMALSDKLQLISWSMTVMALAAIVVWDGLALDARDYAILGPLPIARRTLLEGKLLAMTLFVGAFALVTSAVPIVLYPLAFLSSSHLSLAVGVWVMIGLAAASLGAAAFGFLAVLTVRSLLLNVCGPRVFGRVSVAAQFLMALFVLIGLSNVSAAMLEQGGPRLYLWPPLWFLGVAETIADRGILATLSPAMQRLYGLVDFEAQTAGQVYAAYWPTLQRLALVGATALSGCAVAATLLYFASHFRHASRLRQTATMQPGRRRPVRDVLAWVARRAVVRDPIAQASFFFTLETLGRSARHRLYLAGYVLVGCVLSYTAIVSLATARDAAGAGPTASALSIQPVLAFFLIVGLRVVLAIPAELRANWTFRLTAGGEVDVRRYLAGVRRAIVLAVVLPFFAALCCIQAVSWGPRIALLHFACGFLWALILVDLLLLRFTKLPFTCPQVPGKANLKVLGAVYLFAFLAYAYGFADVEAVALRTVNGSVAMIGGLLVALAGLAVHRHRVLLRRPGFVFEELPEEAVVRLGL